MIVVTTESIPGREIREVLGIVRGNTVRARNAGDDFKAVLRNMIGGEVMEYTKLLAEAREQALDRMMESARELGADAIIGTQFATSSLMAGAAELMVYGTAVRLDEVRNS